ncbi:MAG: ribonuclease E/G [Lachnospiraceae bacterium]|nr:ribonuclease E/G [Lachnospiraceae bacterium]
MIKPKEKNADSKLFSTTSGIEMIAVKKDDMFVYLVFENKILIDIEMENAKELPIHTKCVGKVSSVSKDINSAYIVLPDKSKAFLKNADPELKCEQNIAVEITRASSKGKLQSVKMIDENIEHRTDLSVISYGERAYASCFRRYKFDRIITDNEEIFSLLTEYCKNNNVLELSDIYMYNDSMVSLSVLYSVSKKIKEAVSKIVWLKSGANIVIEETAAFIVIDVNSAKKDRSKNNSFLNINLEACEEIFRQMNLRNLSGIILIDFINISEDEEKILCDKISELCKKQKSYTKLVDITKLGIVEITRKKEGITLNDLNI